MATVLSPRGQHSWGCVPPQGNLQYLHEEVEDELIDIMSEIIDVNDLDSLQVHIKQLKAGHNKFKNASKELESFFLNDDKRLKAHQVRCAMNRRLNMVKQRLHLLEEFIEKAKMIGQVSKLSFTIGSGSELDGLGSKVSIPFFPLHLSWEMGLVMPFQVLVK